MSNLNEIVDNIKIKNFDLALKLCEIYQNTKNKHIILNLRGVIYFSQNNLDKAEIDFLNSFKINDVFIDPIKNLILIYNRKKKFHKSLFFAKKLVQIDKSNPQFNFQLGYAFGENHNYKKTIKYYKKCINLDQKYKYMVLNNMGSIYARIQKYKISNKYYLRSLKYNKNDKILVNNILSNFIGLRDKKNSYIYFQQAKNLDQNYIQFLYYKAEYFFLIGKIDDAIKILEENKKNIIFLTRLTQIYFLIGKNKEGQLLFNSSKEKFLQDSNALNLLWMRSLYEGDFINGWKYYEKARVNPENLLQNVKEWNGENIEKKHIIVFNEQGLGDAIQFSKYIISLLKISNKVTFSVKKSIQKIFRTDIPNLEIQTIDTHQDQEFDYKINLGSLIKFFYKKNIKTNTLIINNKNKLIDLDIKKFDKAKLNVGIAWSGSFNGFYRSIPLKSLNKIFSLDVNYYCLQNEIWERDLIDFNLIKINNLGKYSLDEMTSIIPNLDLVISCDTSLLHLSSSLNQETWGILSLYPDWRWGEFNKINPYNSLKLFHQKKFNKWDDVELEILENLKEKIKEKNLYKNNMINIKNLNNN